MKELAAVDVVQLEAAAIIVWFQQHGETLDEACLNARRFKCLRGGYDRLATLARELATRFNFAADSVHSVPELV